ncbi:laccase-4-like [Mangifera indica]|uniref:laccase-4-like n=1 Tax=Mangifera indica TaxID=29780 RepID=UPI001CFB9B12|nr:laccase-4-like [Mangifera indica]
MATWIRVVVLVMACLLPASAECVVRQYNFDVVMKNTTKLCSTKPIVTINGKFPGPTIIAREDDILLIRVNNRVNYNVTIHWHGVKQFRTGWADGTAYITQCPIQPGESYVHNFTLTGQRGTLFYHAHIFWLRATLHGAIVILPKGGVPYPFPKPREEKVIVLAEWWKSDVEAVINEALQTGLTPNRSDTQTINGYAEPTSSCPSERGYTLQVEPGRTYMLRVINAALNEFLYFKIAGHDFTVVEVDASYTKPYKTDTVLIASGQTTNLLLTTNLGTGKFMISASPFKNKKIATGTLHYIGTPNDTATIVLTPIWPSENTSTPLVDNITDALRSLNSKEYPVTVPLKIDHSLFFTIGLGTMPCPTCTIGNRAVAHINNITFDSPTISLLQAHYFNIKGVYTDDFPANPPNQFDYTGTQPANPQTMHGTRVYRLPYNSTVQLVLQDTIRLALESHPMHLHGFSFYAVGSGLGNFNPIKDPKKFNLVDPVERNTISVPAGGWLAIRFRADNPGVWFMHCHIEVHTTWGMEMAFVVDNGNGPNESVLPPPHDLPKC